MKQAFTALAAAALLAWICCGCATEPKIIPLTGDITVDAPRAMAEGPARDRLLWQYRLAAASMRSGHFEVAKKNLDDALLTVGGIYGKDINAAKSRRYFREESRKTFVGEPYERVMAYYYRGILYWMDGDLDNARACFRSGEFEDRSSIGPQYNADYVLLDYLDGLTTTNQSSDGSDAYQRAVKNSTRFPQPPPYDKNANVQFFFEFGPGPIKGNTGEYGEELYINVPESPIQSVLLKVEGQQIKILPMDDIGFQATTRGARVLDKILENKARFKATTDAVGTGAIVGGAVAAATGDRTSEEVGLGLVAAGLISKIISASTSPEADTRAWDNLPHYLSFANLTLTPGPHDVIVEYQDRDGATLPNFTKHFTVTVTADKKDKAVFVSDQSVTPQNL